MSVSCCKRKRSCYSGQSLEFRCARVSSQAEDGIRDWSVTGVQTYAVLCLRSEEHTSELQSLTNFVCRLLLEIKKINCLRLSDNHIRHMYLDLLEKHTVYSP